MSIILYIRTKHDLNGRMMFVKRVIKNNYIQYNIWYSMYFCNICLPLKYIKNPNMFTWLVHVTQEVFCLVIPSPLLVISNV